jgi:hypothetical protein
MNATEVGSPVVSQREAIDLSISTPSNPRRRIRRIVWHSSLNAPCASVESDVLPRFKPLPGTCAGFTAYTGLGSWNLGSLLAPLAALVVQIPNPLNLLR